MLHPILDAGPNTAYGARPLLQNIPSRQGLTMLDLSICHCLFSFSLKVVLVFGWNARMSGCLLKHARRVGNLGQVLTQQSGSHDPCRNLFPRDSQIPRDSHSETQPYIRQEVFKAKAIASGFSLPVGFGIVARGVPPCYT